MSMFNHGTCIVFLYVILIRFIKSQIYVKISEQLNFYNAESLCLFSYDTHLATIYNDTQNSEGKAMCYRCWIGFTDISSENVFRWIGDSNNDYGTNVTPKGTFPWNDGEPNDSRDQDCVITQTFTNNQGWDDQNCDTFEAASICNYPSPMNILRDSSNYRRVPLVSNIIGAMDILDEINIEFSVFINSFHNSLTNILHIGSNTNMALPWIGILPDIHAYGKQKLYFKWQLDTISHAYASYEWKSQHIQVNNWYHIVLYLKQDHVVITVNNTIVTDENIASHSILSDQNIYLGSPWCTSSNVSLTGLIISTSNTNSIGFFNYLCDFNNRFTVNSGMVSGELNGCNYQVHNVHNVNNVNNVLWLGGNDPSSINWSDYKVELVFTMVSGVASGIVVRTNGEGQYYNIYVNQTKQSIVFGKDLVILHEHYDNESIALNTRFKLRVEANGGQFDVYFQNKFIFTLNNYSYDSGSIGFGDYNSNVKYESLRIIFPLRRNISISPTPSPTNNPSFNPTTETIYNEIADKNEADLIINVLYIVIPIMGLCMICLCIVGFIKHKQLQSDTLLTIENNIIAQTNGCNDIDINDNDINCKYKHRDEIKLWLTSNVGLPQYLEKFLMNGYDSMNIIQEINDKDQLSEIGIIMIGHQTKIIVEINKLKRKYDDINAIQLQSKQNNNNNDKEIQETMTDEGDEGDDGVYVTQEGPQQT